MTNTHMLIAFLCFVGIVCTVLAVAILWEDFEDDIMSECGDKHFGAQGE